MSIKFVSIILFLILTFSLLPSLQVPYLMDDFDIIRGLNTSRGPANFTRCLFTPHNEHNVPVIKCFYWLFYRFFWLNSWPFHILIIATYFFLSLMLYMLLFRMTGSQAVSLIAAALFAVSNAYTPTIITTTYCHILFSVFFVFFLLYSVFRYCETEKKAWQAASFVACLFAGLTFALGLAAFFLAALFLLLCVPKELRGGQKKIGRTLFPLFVAFIFVAVTYVLFSTEIMHVVPDEMLKGKLLSLFTGINASQKIALFFKPILANLMPILACIRFVSIGLFSACLFFLIAGYRSVNWKRIVFFLSVIVFNYAAVSIFRGRFREGQAYLRYNLMPAVCLVSIYAISFEPFLKKQKKHTKKIITNAIFAGLIILSVFTLFQRFDFVRSYVLNAKVSYYFCLQFRDAVTGYLNRKDRDALNLANTVISFPPYIYPYQRPLSYYGDIVLSRNTIKSIRWGIMIDKPFLSYLRINKDKYRIFTVISRYDKLYE